LQLQQEEVGEHVSCLIVMWDIFLVLVEQGVIREKRKRKLVDEKAEGFQVEIPFE
jgi:hypothetical protein